MNEPSRNSDAKLSGLLARPSAPKYSGLLPTTGLTLREVTREKRRAKAKARFEAMDPETRAARKAAFQGFTLLLVNPADVQPDAGAQDRRESEVQCYGRGV